MQKAAARSTSRRTTLATETLILSHGVNQGTEKRCAGHVVFALRRLDPTCPVLALLTDG